MKYIQYGADGKSESLRLAETSDPVPGADDILIRVEAAGVNRPDVSQRQGNYAPPPDASPILGLEVSGQVAAVGSAVTQWQVGDPVCALVPGASAHAAIA